MADAAVALMFAHLLYDQACCADKHCRPVPCSEITQTSDGWQWQGQSFHRVMLRESPDGNCHVCIDTVPRCIYLPSRA